MIYAALTAYTRGLPEQTGGEQQDEIKTICLVSVFLSLTLMVISGCAAREKSTEQVSGTPQDVGPELQSGQYDSLAKCLADSGAVLYGTEWCGYCRNQKNAFGESFRLISYVDCDANSPTCQEAGIRGYPTWVIGGRNYPGMQELSRLAGLAGCEGFVL